MIKYALVCGFEHAFEGWFGSSGDYDEQRARGQIACPLCGATDIRKQIMAPAVAGTKAQAAPSAAGDTRRTMMMEAMGRVRQHVLDTFDDVGDAFAVEARAIHEGRSEDRGIYGEASPKDVRELIQDGVQVAPLPPEPPKKRQVN
jgi:hypothetical protein